MSDTTAFLSGCAIAAVATFIILDRGPNFDNVNPCPGSHQNHAPSAAETLPPAPVPSYPPPGTERLPPMNDRLEQQRLATQQLEARLEKQQTENQQLEAQLERQRMERQQLMLQLQQQALPKPTSQEPGNIQTILLWVVGGVALFLILGVSLIVVVVVLTLFMQLQQQSYRTAHMVHPIDMGTPRRISGRPTRVFAQSPKIRRTENIE